MGRTRESKEGVVAELKECLDEAQVALIIDYKGLSVAEISDLRNRLRPVGTRCKVAKNTLMRIAIGEEERWQPMQEFLKESTAVLFVQEDASAAIKAYKAFQKDTKKTQLRGGVMEGRALSQADVEAIGDLPSKEQLYAQIAGGINAVATKLAVAINEVPSSLARALQAVADKDKADDAA